ncbi:MAG: cobalt ECF transporter T component CbiQ [Gammaproteobacteria bacterium]|jgi:cobalt/nickel transport system permease protein|nr:cobalt ECF transporter T component CbiQ [Gammaproteobacteria bacterium]
MFWVTSIDPRVRIILALLFSLVVVSLKALPLLLVAFAMGLLILPGSGLSWQLTLKRMLAMDGFILLMLIMLPFTVAGDFWFSIAGFTATWQGLWRAVEIALKANAIVLMLLTLVGSMESVTLGHALGKLRVSRSLVHLLLFTVRYVEVLKEEYQRLRQAMQARAFRPGNNWHTYRSFGYLFGMLLVRAMERSERVMEAMQCRGFNGQLPMLAQLRMGLMDWVFISVMLAALGGLMYLEIYRVII